LRFNDEVEARLASGAFYETIVLVAFYEIIKIVGIKIGGNLREKFDFRIELAKGLPQPGIGRGKSNPSVTGGYSLWTKVRRKGKGPPWPEGPGPAMAGLEP